MDCVICDKIKEKKALIVFEDDNLIAILPSKPAVPGHIKIMPKQHFTKLDELPDELVEELFFLSNFSSSAVFEAVKAHGTNIILNESDSHLAVDVIPRKENDGLNFMWKPKQLSQVEMDEVHSKVKDKAFVINKNDNKKLEPKLPPAPAQLSQPAALPAPTDEKADEVLKIPKEDKTNYLIKHLTKIP